MPIYEYECIQCRKRSEFFIRKKQDKPVCECGSREMKRVYSAFAVSDGSESGIECSDGSCGIPAMPCSSGRCGLS
ncbi:MAG TPA: hypothetical protein ENN03_03075 [bacterium]|nr:hypothetical protein [bacterium]